MHKLILIISFLLGSSTGWAFSDSATNTQLDRTIQALKLESRVDKKARHLEAFRNFLYQRLNTIDLALIEANPDDFASLNEFYGFIGQIDGKELSATACRKTRDNMLRLFRDNGLSQEAADQLPTSQFPAATESLRLLNALCGN